MYARNLAGGDGLVFTPGYERVEGFTSAGWMLIDSAVFWLSPWRESALLAISVALCACSIASLLSILRRLFGSEPLAWVMGIAWLLVVPAFYAWSTVTLMDVPLWGAVVCGTSLSLVRILDGDAGSRSRWALAALCGAAVITRPESMALVPGVLVVGALCLRARAPRMREVIAPLVPAIGVFCATVLAVEVFRLAYFGHPLPNTYYAKVPPSRLFAMADGARYLTGFALDQPHTLLLLPALVAALLPMRALLRRRPVVDERTACVFALACVVCMGLALPLYGGGDHMGSFRMYQPFVPLMVVPSVDFVLRRAPPPGRGGARSASWC